MSSFSKSSELAPTRWTAACYAYAALVAAGLGYFLLAVPIQLTDSFGNMLQLRDGTLLDLVYNQFYQRGYLRPLLWGHLRVVYDLSGGHYYEWFRGWHVLQICLLFVLFLRLLRPRTAADFAAAAVGLAALIGIHTFAGTVREAFPINTFMTILLCCFAAADLALGEPRWWRDVLAWMLFAFAALTVESGLLVAVVFVAGFLAGARGVSRAGLAGVLLLLAGYFWLRFSYLDVGAPALSERSSGFWLGRLEPEELDARFGGNPFPFYIYNVLSSVASVLFAEPRGGVFALTRDILNDEVRVPAVVNALSSTIATLLMIVFAWQRRHVWLARRFERIDQLALMFWVVLFANAAISYGYTKDVIMSPAGAFYALALTAACAHLLRTGLPAGLSSAVVAVALVVASSLWAWRMVGIHVALRHSAVTMRNEWAYADQWFARERNGPTAPRDILLKQQLQEQAVRRSIPYPSGDWLEWFEE